MGLGEKGDSKCIKGLHAHKDDDDNKKVIIGGGQPHIDGSGFPNDHY